MKKILSFLLFMLVVLFNVQACKAISYKDAMESSKPVAILVYASWAEDIDSTIKIFNDMGKRYSDKYNFVLLNIASEDTKLFNKTYHIYPNLPYVLLFRDRGKFSRYLQRNCADDVSCFSNKLEFFLR